MNARPRSAAPRALAAALRRQWRRSLQLRVVAFTVLLCLAALVVLGGFLNAQISRRLFDARQQQAFAESARAAADFQSRLDQANVPTAADLQRFVGDSRTSLESVGGEAAEGMLLLRVPDSDAPWILNGSSSGGVETSLLTPELREAVQTQDTQQSAPVELADGTPGLVVGQRVTLTAQAGEYELYFVFNLAQEQSTLEAVQRVLAVGALLLVILVGGVAWVVTWLVVRPVREAAGAAARLSDGDLDERLAVRGEDDLARLARSFNDMAGSLQHQITQLAELSRLQQRFVSDVSHELRTPLTTIRMAGEVLHEAREDFDPASARSAELLMTQLDRFETLLADLLEISRFDAGAMALDAEVVDVRSLVHHVVEMAEPLAAAKGLRIAVQVPKQSATAEVESRRIQRVLRNLVVNAVEHSEGRPVEVVVGADDAAVAVVVRDHGVGLRPEDAERVFDRFWRADPARARTTGGTGLGLAISLEDAHLHGGTLEVVGQPGRGAAFRLVLPRMAGTGPFEPPLPMPTDLQPSTPTPGTSGTSLQTGPISTVAPASPALGTRAPGGTPDRDGDAQDAPAAVARPSGSTRA